MRIGALSSSRHTFILIITIILICNVNSQTTPNCSSNDDPLRGCLNCTSPTFGVINVTSKRIVCLQIDNCSVVMSNGSCLICSNSSAIDISTGLCTLSPGCRVTNGSICLQCYNNTYILNSTGQCNQIIINYCWQTNVTSCLECSNQNSMQINNCSISNTTCLLFDYQKWMCTQCPSGMTLHISHAYCYNTTNLSNCLIIQQSACLQCNPGYYIQGGICLFNQSINLFLQLLPNSYYLNTNSFNYQTYCLNSNQKFDNTTANCISTATSFLNCLIPGLTSCSVCLPAFYLNATSICKPCSIFDYCLSCDQFNCKLCDNNHYLVVQLGNLTIDSFFTLTTTSASYSKCLPCSIYGCLRCRSEFKSNSINQIRCDQCLFGYKLYNYTCFKCPSGQYFANNSICTNCTIANCQYCNSNHLTCDQCITGFYFNTTEVIPYCRSISLVLTQNYLNSVNAFQILNKSLPFSSTPIVNDQKLLITSCYGSSNGYSCLCSNTSLVTSLCQPISPLVASLTLDATSLFGSTSTVLTKSQFIANQILLRMLSELPNCNFMYNPLINPNIQLLSVSQFASYLQIITNMIRNNNTQTNSLLYPLSQFVFNQMSKTFSTYQPTILSGPGYYFKFTPSTYQKDDASFLSTNQTGIRQSQMAIIFFNGTIDLSVKRITGTVYIFLNQATAAQLNLRIKKLNFLGNNQKYTVLQNNNVITFQINSDNQGYISINGLTTSTSTSLFSYYVSTAATTASIDIYSSQRIQNIIYRDSFIYILVFLALYLILLPTCALVDFVDNKSSKRKEEKEESSTYQNIKHKAESDHQQQQIILKINYKDFFPIYNIANTERPKRMLKLCLFIVNSQHSVTFLTLIYYHLSAGQPLVAVLLAIPAYICTVIMGYLCGMFTLKLPGNWNYCINLFTLGYWIIWVAVMGQFTSAQYKPFVFTFVIIFFFLDLLIDFLQTLLIYFTIKQQERQVRLFEALSRWLSYRGYYEFDRMARRIKQIRQTG